METRATPTICQRLISAGPWFPTKVLLLDLWGKKQAKGAVFADITWVAVTSARVPDEVSRAFRAVADARDSAVRLVVEAARDGRISGDGK